MRRIVGKNDEKRHAYGVPRRETCSARARHGTPLAGAHAITLPVYIPTANALSYRPRTRRSTPTSSLTPWIRNDQLDRGSTPRLQPGCTVPRDSHRSTSPRSDQCLHHSSPLDTGPCTLTSTDRSWSRTLRRGKPCRSPLRKCRCTAPRCKRRNRPCHCHSASAHPHTRIHIQRRLRERVRLGTAPHTQTRQR